METREVLDTSILIGGMGGLTTIFNIIEHPPAYSTCSILFPEKLDLDRAVDIAWKLRLIGKLIGAVDILVASMCINRNLKLLTKDNYFSHIREVEKDFEVVILK